MILTFTSEFEHTAKENKKEAPLLAFGSDEPSDLTLQNILNYSKNLEVKQAKLLPFIEFLKS
jgi:hypothetical protein